jgi:bisphosphoglycerate-independent phosphoglycerate mutase (AlkP superfamily)
MKIKMESATISKTAVETVDREIVELVTEAAEEMQIMVVTGADADRAEETEEEWDLAKDREEREERTSSMRTKTGSAIILRTILLPINNII